MQTFPASSKPFAFNPHVRVVLLVAYTIRAIYRESREVDSPRSRKSSWHHGRLRSDCPHSVHQCKSDTRKSRCPQDKTLLRKQKKKVQQSDCRSGQGLKISGGWGAQISRQSAHEGCKVVSPTHWPSLPPRKYPWYSFLLGTESTPGP